MPADPLLDRTRVIVVLGNLYAGRVACRQRAHDGSLGMIMNDSEAHHVLALVWG